MPVWIFVVPILTPRQHFDNIIFDLEIPFGVKTTKEDVVAMLNEHFDNKGKTHYFVITVDRV